MKLFIGCSSRNEIPSIYYDYCQKFIEELFQEDYDLVFGACQKGLMGVAYNLALNKGCNITGIYPEVYKHEAKGLKCRNIPVQTVGERTESCINESDVLIFLPGGIGTIYELFTAIESKRAKEHNKPIIIYNCSNFYDNLLLQLDKTVQEQFTSSEDTKYYYVCNNAREVIKYLNSYHNN